MPTNPSGGGDQTRRVVLEGQIRVKGGAEAEAASKQLGGLGKKFRDGKHNAESYRRTLHGTAQMSSNSTKEFAKQAQTVENSLVPAYAKIASTVFATTAIFNQFKRAADLVGLQDALVAFANNSGIAMEGLAARLQDATNAQINFQQAARVSTLGVASGVTASQLEELARQATTIAQALGRDVQDTLQRLIRGVTQSQPDLLKQIGILVNLEDAQRRYAEANNITARSLSNVQRAQAILAAITEDYNNKFAQLEDNIASNEFERLARAFESLVESAQGFAVYFVEPIAALLAGDRLLMFTSALFAFSGLARNVITTLMGPEAVMRSQENARRRVQVEEERVAQIRQVLAQEEAEQRAHFQRMREAGQRYSGDMRQLLVREAGVLREKRRPAISRWLLGTGDMTPADTRIARNMYNQAIAQLDQFEAGGRAKRTDLLRRLNREQLETFGRQIRAQETLHGEGLTRMAARQRAFTSQVKSGLNRGIAAARIGVTRLFSSWGRVMGLAFSAAFFISLARNLPDHIRTFNRAITSIQRDMAEIVIDARINRSQVMDDINWFQRQLLRVVEFREGTPTGFSAIFNDIIDAYFGLERVLTPGDGGILSRFLLRADELADNAAQSFEEMTKQMAEYDRQQMFANQRQEAGQLADRLRSLDGELQNIFTSIGQASEFGVRQLSALSTAMSNVPFEDVANSAALLAVQVAEGNKDAREEARQLETAVGRLAQRMVDEGLLAEDSLQKFSRAFRITSDEGMAYVRMLQRVSQENAEVSASIQGLTDVTETLTNARQEFIASIDRTDHDGQIDNLKQLLVSMSEVIAGSHTLADGLEDEEEILNQVSAALGVNRNSLVSMADALKLTGATLQEFLDFKEQTLALQDATRQAEFYAAVLSEIDGSALASANLSLLEQRNTIREARIELAEATRELRNHDDVTDATGQTLQRNVNRLREQVRQEKVILSLKEAQLASAREESQIQARLRQLDRTDRLISAFEGADLASGIAAVARAEQELLEGRNELLTLQRKINAAEEDIDFSDRLSELGDEVRLRELNLELLQKEANLIKASLQDEIARVNLQTARDVAQVDTTFFGERLERELRVQEQILEVQALQRQEQHQQALIERARKTESDEYVRSLEMQQQLTRAQLQGEEARLTLLRAQGDAAIQLAQAIDESFQSSFAENLSSIIKGEQGLRESIKNVGDAVLGGMADSLAQSITETLFGDQSIAGRVLEAHIEGGEAAAEMVRAAHAGEDAPESEIWKQGEGVFSKFISKISDVFGIGGGGFLGMFQGMIGKLIGSIAGLFSGEGANLFGSVASLLPFATGGIAPGGFQAFAQGSPVVDKPTLGLVGEGKYNEAVVPLPDGKSIPVSMPKNAGMQQNNVEVNVSIDGNGTATIDSNEVGNVGRRIGAAVRKELQNEMRPGGILSKYGAA